MKSIARRSDCPISFSLEILGDKWTLLILRDMIMYDKSSFGKFLSSDEKIATNILTERLNTLCEQQLIRKCPCAKNRRRQVYLLTDKGIGLVPVLLDLTVWASDYNPDEGLLGLLKKMGRSRSLTIREYQTRLRERNKIRTVFLQDITAT